MKITDYIPIGKDHAISRARLREMSGLSDRQMREAIEEARHDGAIICAKQTKGGGYYIAGDLEEVKEQYWQTMHRALSLLHWTKTMRSVLKEAGYETH